MMQADIIAQRTINPFPRRVKAMKIMRISSDRAAQFHALRLKALTTDPEVFIATKEEETAQTFLDTQKLLESHYTLGAFLKGELIGMLMLIEQTHLKFKHIGILGSMYVEPAYRNLGIGSKLLNRMLKIMKKFPLIEALQLKVIPSNFRAIKLYQSFGFTKWASEKNALKYGGKYFDQDHYQLELH